MRGKLERQCLKLRSLLEYTTLHLFELVQSKFSGRRRRTARLQTQRQQLVHRRHRNRTEFALRPSKPFRGFWSSTLFQSPYERLPSIFSRVSVFENWINKVIYSPVAVQVVEKSSLIANGTAALWSVIFTSLFPKPSIFLQSTQLRKSESTTFYFQRSFELRPKLYKE